MTTEFTQEQLQKYWDAMLIRSWRQFGTVGELRDMFFQTCGVNWNEVQILRNTPPLHGRVTTRVFVAKYLPKISERLFSQEPAKDVNLLRALQSSKYDTYKAALPDRERQNMQSQVRRDKLRIAFEHAKYKGRNRDTDWGVTK